MSSKPHTPSSPRRPSFEELRAEAEKLIKQAEALSTRELDTTINFLDDKLRAIGKTKKDAVLGLCMLMKPAELEATLAALTGTQLHQPFKGSAATDSQGNLPVPGVTYQLPDGRIWTRKSVGAVSKDFAAHAQTTTWEAMKA